MNCALFRKKAERVRLGQKDEKQIEINDMLKTEISLRNVSEYELKNNQEKLLKYVKELEGSNQSLEEFAMIASHDLQEPLRKIITFGDRLKSFLPDLEDEGTDCLEHIFRAAHRIHELIRDLIQYSRINFSEKETVPVDLNELVDYVLSDLGLLISRLKGRASTDFLPTIKANPIQTRLLFQNLISNAIKFSREGAPLDSSISFSDKNQDFQRILIKDNGIGFDQKFATRIFQFFERLNPKLSFEGSGIGFAIYKKIVDCFGCKISALG